MLVAVYFIETQNPKGGAAFCVYRNISMTTDSDPLVRQPTVCSVLKMNFFRCQISNGLPKTMASSQQLLHGEDVVRSGPCGRIQKYLIETER